jgi:predicted negative regulator of RcsB-dependent stress response
MADTGDKTRSAELIRYWKSRIIFLSIGLVLGPIVSGWIGWHVTTDTMDTAVQDAVIAYRAELCAKRAQADPDATSEVLENWTSRRELAEKWAILPSEEKVDRDVVSACESRLKS